MARRTVLAAEYATVFFGVVGVYALVKVPGGPVPALVVLAVAVVCYLRSRPDFDRRDLWRATALRPALPSIVALWGVAAVVAVVGVAAFQPAHLADLPRRQPLLWLAVCVGYPVLSVYPQELLFRAFLMHRYAPLFRSSRSRAAGSAVAFGFAHVLFGNWLAVGLTLVGGWLFARRYERSRSLLTVGVEHAGYGLIIFTVGLGRYFYHGGTPS